MQHEFSQLDFRFIRKLKAGKINKINIIYIMLKPLVEVIMKAEY